MYKRLLSRLSHLILLQLNSTSPPPVLAAYFYFYCCCKVFCSFLCFFLSSFVKLILTPHTTTTTTVLYHFYLIISFNTAFVTKVIPIPLSFGWSLSHNSGPFPPSFILQSGLVRISHLLSVKLLKHLWPNFKKMMLNLEKCYSNIFPPLIFKTFDYFFCSLFILLHW